MCLAIPGKVLKVSGQVANVDFSGVRKQVRLDVVDHEVAAGDHVLVHVGYAIRRIPDDQVSETLALFDALLRCASDGDLMAADVRSELAATREVDDRGDS